MLRRVQGVVLVVAAVLVFPLPSGAQAPPSDPEVVKGIQQVEDGDFESAILTLDAAARRLAAKTGSARDLADAYVFLGVAYLGKGAETSAKAQFREALGQVKDLKLSPEKFAPKVIEIFEKARDERMQSAAAAPPATPTAAAPRGAAPTPASHGGGHKGLWIGGVVVAAGAGVALAAAGGGSAPSTSPTPAPAHTRTDTFNVPLNPDQTHCCPDEITVTRAGTLTMVATWPDPRAVIQIGFISEEASGPSMHSDPPPPPFTRVELTASVPAGRYRLSLYRFPGDPPGPIPVTLTVTYPFN